MPDPALSHPPVPGQTALDRGSASWAVVFDLDGTLVDSSHDITRALNIMLAEHRLPGLRPAQVEPLLGEGARSLVVAVYAILGLDPGPDRLTTDTERYLSHYAAEPVKDSVLYRDAHTTLVQLRDRGVPLGVCTNKNAGLARRVLAELGVADLFAAVVGGDSLAVRKPHPGHLLATVAALGADPARTLFVGDSHIDAECGRRAGIDCLLVDWGVSNDGSRRITAFDELLVLLPSDPNLPLPVDPPPPPYPGSRKDHA